MKIYPIDVAKTVYQKALLSAGSGHAERPRIKLFGDGAYRGESRSVAARAHFQQRCMLIFVAGLGVSVLRSCVINAIFFSNFEMIKKRINAFDV